MKKMSQRFMILFIISHFEGKGKELDMISSPHIDVTMGNAIKEGGNKGKMSCTRRALIIDDSAVIHKSLSRALTDLGFAITIKEK